MKKYYNVVTEIQEIRESLFKIVDAPTDSDVIALTQIAVDIQRNMLIKEQNEILKKGFVVSPTDKYPSALESIAMRLERNAE
jgi:hypothetical protein